MKQSALAHRPLATFHFFFFLISAVIFSSTISWGQSLTSGGITGTVLDPSGAAVSGATITLKSRETGATQTTTSNATGAYRFSLLNPGDYSVSASSQGFQGATEHTVSVAVGQIATVNINLAVASALSFPDGSMAITVWTNSGSSPGLIRQASIMSRVQSALATSSM